jgi:hypothetical protein
MTDQLPVWLLDVDGVINAYVPAWTDMVKVKCAGVTIRYAPVLVDRIRTLHASRAVEVRWCTTWCGYPELLADLEALLDVAFAPAFGDRPLSKTWAEMKAEAAVAVLAEGRRLVWTDDSEVDAGRRLYPAIQRGETDSRAHLVAPESRYGLTADDVLGIEAFLRAPLTDEQIISSPAGVV